MSKHILWGRVGMTFTLTDEELKQLQDPSEDKKKLLHKWLMENKVGFDGETYFPEGTKVSPINDSINREENGEDDGEFAFFV